MLRYDGASFDDEMLHNIGEAYDIALVYLNGRVTSDPSGGLQQETLASVLLALASHGEFNKIRLANLAIGRILHMDRASSLMVPHHGVGSSKQNTADLR